MIYMRIMTLLSFAIVYKMFYIGSIILRVIARSNALCTLGFLIVPFRGALIFNEPGAGFNVPYIYSIVAFIGGSILFTPLVVFIDRAVANPPVLPKLLVMVKPLTVIGPLVAMKS